MFEYHGLSGLGDVGRESLFLVAYEKEGPVYINTVSTNTAAKKGVTTFPQF